MELTSRSADDTKQSALFLYEIARINYAKSVGLSCALSVQIHLLILEWTILVYKCNE